MITTWRRLHPYPSDDQQLLRDPPTGNLEFGEPRVSASVPEDPLGACSSNPDQHRVTMIVTRQYMPLAQAVFRCRDLLGLSHLRLKCRSCGIALRDTMGYSSSSSSLSGSLQESGEVFYFHGMLVTMNHGRRAAGCYQLSSGRQSQSFLGSSDELRSQCTSQKCPRVNGKRAQGFSSQRQEFRETLGL